MNHSTHLQNRQVVELVKEPVVEVKEDLIMKKQYVNPRIFSDEFDKYIKDIEEDLKLDKNLTADEEFDKINEEHQRRCYDDNTIILTEPKPTIKLISKTPK